MYHQTTSQDIFYTYMPIANSNLFAACYSIGESNQFNVALSWNPNFKSFAVPDF